MTDYFSHDVEAADDIKMMRLQMDMKGQGYAIWWRLLELLWKNDCKMDYDPDLLAYNIRWCTADEVRQVVENYDLFTVQDGQFWNQSQQNRWEEKKAISEAKAAAGRRGAAVTNAQRASENGSAAAEPQQTSGSAAAEPQPCCSNKLINKLINKSLSERACARASEKEERERIFIKFLFKNIKEPAKEVDRYWSNYAGVGWVAKSGNPITDRVAYSDGWKPEQSGRNFDGKALGWLKDVYHYAVEQRWPLADAIPLALLDIASDNCGNLTVVFHDKEAAVQIKQYILDNNLAGSWASVLWQTGSKRIK